MNLDSEVELMTFWIYLEEVHIFHLIMWYLSVSGCPSMSCQTCGVLKTFDIGQQSNKEYSIHTCILVQTRKKHISVL